MKNYNKKTSSILATLFFFTIFSSCISYSNVPLTECNHPSGWCKEIRDLANISWKYAQLSKNVYNKPFQYDVTKHFDKIKDYENRDLSFFATLYREKSTGQFIFIYRGTDSLKDFQTGNNPFNQKQNKYALEIYDQSRDSLRFTNCIVAGHSLGGGIATHISLNRNNVKSFSFNGSPVFRNKLKIINDRYSIVENGEVLKIARIFGREADQLYTSIGCSTGNAINQHDMQSLATCITQIAAATNTEATESLLQNGIIAK